jgi:hypothetical protein
VNKAKLHHHLKPARLIPISMLVGLTVFFLFVSAVALRQNNQRAIDLRDQVLLADKEDGDVNKALGELRSHVYSHMNTNLATATSVYPPVQLKYRYERLVAGEQERASKINEKIYSDAQKYCENKNSSDFSGRNRVPCIQEYVSKRGEEPRPIPADLYKFDFSSPAWSPDLAGWSLVAAVFFGLLSLARVGLEVWIRSYRI